MRIPISYNFNGTGNIHFFVRTLYIYPEFTTPRSFLYHALLNLLGVHFLWFGEGCGVRTRVSSQVHRTMARGSADVSTLSSGFSCREQREQREQRYHGGVGAGWCMLSLHGAHWMHAQGRVWILWNRGLTVGEFRSFDVAVATIARAVTDPRVQKNIFHI